MGHDALLRGGSSRLESEVRYGVKLGQRLVGTPRRVVRTSQYGREHLVGYRVTALEQGTVNLELGTDAERREMRGFQQLQGEGTGGDQHVLGRASLGW